MFFRLFSFVSFYYETSVARRLTKTVSRGNKYENTVKNKINVITLIIMPLTDTHTSTSTWGLSSNRYSSLLLLRFFVFCQVFVHAKVFFSIGGRQFNGEPVQFSYMPDQVLDHARDVTIKLHHRLGRYLQLHLYFAARWMMLSEITFVSGKRLQLQLQLQLLYNCNCNARWANKVLQQKLFY